MKYLVGDHNQVVSANQQIELNCGIPNAHTECWDLPKKANNQDFWFIAKPSEIGWNGYTQAQMMQDVVDVVEMNSEDSWFPLIEI